MKKIINRILETLKKIKEILQRILFFFLKLLLIIWLIIVIIVLIIDRFNLIEKFGLIEKLQSRLKKKKKW